MSSHRKSFLALVCALLWATPSQAAWSLVSSDAVFLFAGSASNAKNHVAGHLLVALIAGGVAGGPTTVTSISNTAGDTWLQCASSYASVSTFMGDVWYVKSTAGNAADVVTPVIANTLMQGSLITLEYSGQDATAACEVGANGNATSATSVTTGSFSPAASGNLNVAILGPQSQSGAFTAGSGYTIQITEGTAACAAEDNQNAGSGSQTATATHASAVMVISLASFKPAVVAATARRGTLLGVGP